LARTPESADWGSASRSARASCARRLRAVAVKLLLPFHHVAAAAVFRDQLMHLIAALAPILAAFDAQHIELAFDVAEDEVSAAALGSLTAKIFPQL